MRMAAVSVVKGLVVALALAVTGACGPRKAALGTSGGASGGDTGALARAVGRPSRG